MPVSVNTDTVEHSGMNDHVTCLILKSLDYREADSILTVLTEEYGKVTFFARGVRKVHSKNAGQIQLYCKSDFLYDHAEGKTSFTLRTASCLNYYRHMKENLSASVASGVISETVCELLEEGERVEGVFEMTEKAFQLLDEGASTDTVLALFLSDLLKVSGLGVHVDSCTLCGSSYVHAVSVEDGGFLCESCARQKGIPLSSLEELKRFRILGKGGLAHYDLINGLGGATGKDVILLMAILRRNSGITVRSFELYKQL